MAALHHRAKKELADIAAALQQSYADTRAEAAAAYRLQVRGRCAAACLCGMHAGVLLIHNKFYRYCSAASGLCLIS